MHVYQSKLRSTLSPGERRVFEKLRTPQLAQDFLDSFPVNTLGRGEHTMMSPREILKNKKAHCMEGALLAATTLAYHGGRPLLLDLKSIDGDFDHVVALFKQNGLWGAISKTNHPVLRYRDPVYQTVRELAMSYFHEYFYGSTYAKNVRGKKTMRSYSRPFDLRRFGTKWIVAAGDLDHIAEALDDSPHFPIMPTKTLKLLRKASLLEIKATDLTEWPEKK